MVFRYVIQNSDGKRYYGKLRAEKQETLKKRFLEAGYDVLILEEFRKSSKDTRDKEIFPLQALKKRALLRLKREQKSHFIQQLAVLLDSGIELYQGLWILHEQAPRFSRIALFLQDLLQRIASGESFSDALKLLSVGFSSCEIAMIHAGESVGKLPQALSHLAELILKSARIRKKLVSASFYPITVLCVALLVVSALTLFVIPRFQEVLFDQVSADAMPKLTLLILNCSHFGIQYWPKIVLLVVITVISFVFLRRWKFLQILCEKVLLKIPALKGVVMEWNVILFARTFGELLTCSVPLVEALRLSKEIVKSAMIHRALEKVLSDIALGMSLAEAFRRHRVFPPDAQGLLALGDRSGKTGIMMGRIAENYEYRLHENIERLMRLLEPCLVVFLAVFVGTIVVGLFLPLVTLIQGFSGH